MSDRDYAAGWSTHEEIYFLKMLEMCGRRLALTGYAKSFAVRTRWGAIDSGVVAMWLRTRKLLPGSTLVAA